MPAHRVLKLCGTKRNETSGIKRNTRQPEEAAYFFGLRRRTVSHFTHGLPWQVILRVSSLLPDAVHKVTGYCFLYAPV